MTTATSSLESSNPLTNVSGNVNGPSPSAAVDMKQRLLKNKPLIGLGIVILLLFSVGQFIEAPSHISHGAKSARGEEGKEEAQSLDNQESSSEQAKPIKPIGNGLTPSLATEFVTWWINKAMDYSAPTAARSHSEAFGWMTPLASSTFKQVFWTPAIAQGITQGRMTAAFQPVSVQALAFNPDGTIVVTVQGSLVVQDTAAPVSQQIVTDFLVRKEKEGLRIAAMYNRTSAP